VDEGLYHKVLNRCVEDGKMCMNEMMAIDAAGGRPPAHHSKTSSVTLPLDVCTSKDADRVVALLDEVAASELSHSNK
jgi:cytochrome o ubiquinol oxidase subunit 2